MNRIGVAAGAVALGGVAWLATREAPPRPPARPPDRATAAAPADTAARTLDLAPEARAPAPPAPESPELARHREALAFSAAVREFFDPHAELG